MIIGLFIDIWNWLYTRNRIQLMRMSTEIMQTNKLRISVFGVLYTIVEVDKSIPDALVERFLMKKLSIIDDALVSINLDGLMHFTHKIYGETNTTRYVLVKFVPNMPHWNWRYFLTSCALAFVIIKLVIYYDLWPKIFNIYKILIEALLS